MVWTQQLLLDGEHAIANPSACATASCTSPGRSPATPDARTLHLPADWPWAGAILRAFKRLDALPAYG